MSDKLSKRMHHGHEAAPWVIEEVEELEAKVKELEQLTANDGIEIGSYTHGTGLRGEWKQLQLTLDQVENQNTRLRTIFESRSHACGGRDCIGYLVEWDSATQNRCGYCTQVYDALAPEETE